MTAAPGAATPTGHPGMADDHTMWRDGAFLPWDEATVHVSSVGHASVSASFEGIHAYATADGNLAVFRLADHLQRLLTSVRLAATEAAFTMDELVEASLELCRRNRRRSDTYVRPWCFAKGIHREQMVPAGSPVEICIDVWPFTTKLGTPLTATAVVSSWTRFSPASMPPQLKAFSNYHNGRLGNIEARARGADWPIFLTPVGHVTESSGANVAVVVDGVLTMPSLGSGVLDGFTRQTALQLCASLGIPTELRDISRSELYTASEVLFLGTAAEVLPIVAVDGLTVGRGTAGDVTATLAARYLRLVRGELDEHREWLFPVW